jgi:trans-aconitate methyltransferase
VSSTAQEIRAAIARAQQLDAQWQRNPAGRDDARSTPWMPFPLFDFIALVAEALPDSAGESFLEVGCGIGTRMLVASTVFGLDAHGIDRVDEYVAQASELGCSAEVADALTWDDYGKYDVIWFNRPFRDRGLQRQLEARVWEAMKPGAVVIWANLEMPPPANWWPVLIDTDRPRGITQKPAAS